MAQSNIKDRMIQTLQDLPDNVTFESTMDRLNPMYKVELGIAQVDAGQKIAHGEVRQRIMKWLGQIGPSRVCMNSKMYSDS